MLKPLTVDHNRWWKILKEVKILDHLTCLLRNLYAGQEHIKAEYCHPAYLTYMPSTSCKIPGWLKHNLESRLPEEISTPSAMQMIPL